MPQHEIMLYTVGYRAMVWMARDPIIVECTVEALLTHTSWFCQNAMGYEGLWVDGNVTFRALILQE